MEESRNIPFFILLNWK